MNHGTLKHEQENRIPGAHLSRMAPPLPTPGPGAAWKNEAKSVSEVDFDSTIFVRKHDALCTHVRP